MPLLRRAFVALVALVPALLVSVGSAGAAPGPACGDTIVASVSLSRNLDCSSFLGSPALTVGADSVILNLNGHTITGPGGGANTDGIDVIGRSFVTVKNGTIANFAYDLYFQSTYKSTAQSLKLVLDGSWDYTGFEDDGSQGTLAKNIRVANAAEGIYFYGTSNATMTASSATDSQFPFDDEYSVNDLITGNSSSYAQIAFFGYDGVATTWAKNTAKHSYQDGFFNQYDDAGYGGDSYVGNKVTDSEDIGFELEGDSYGGFMLQGNTASGSGDDGYFIDYAFNEQCSCATDQGSSITGNKATNNGGVGFDDGHSNNSTYSGNTATGNALGGMYLWFPRNQVVTKNVLSNNGGAGLYLDSNDPGTGDNAKSVANNTANGNDDYGIYAQYPQAGSGNIAKGNVPYDCWNIACQTGATLATAPAKRVARHVARPAHGAHPARHPKKR